jgi:nucleotide-binding universal stress UspA family protein
MGLTYEKVLVAIDGSESSTRILEHVRALAAIHQSEVIVYHVRQKAYSGASTIEVDPPPAVSTEHAVNELKGDGISARAIEENAYWGHTANAILDAAGRYSVKAIVIGTRGRSRLPAAVLGSVAYKVLHLSELPVLVIP